MAYQLGFYSWPFTRFPRHPLCRTHVKEKPEILLTILDFPTAKGLTLVSEVVPDTFADPTVLGWPDCRTDFPTPGTRQLGTAQLSEKFPDTRELA